MALFCASLNSGSNGNCYYISNETDAILVDAGISCSETERRMKRLNLGMDKVKAIFISHEHSDHINGLATLSKKYRLPVYITDATQRHGKIHLDKKMIQRFQTGHNVPIGKLNILPFTKAHDACDPHSFLITSASVSVGVFTDIGIACEKVICHFKQCHAAFLEANYDTEMLMNGNYPVHLKKRISGGNGHLSNDQALDLFIQHRPAFMSHLILSHLSKNNNDAELVCRLFRQHAAGTIVQIASRTKETEVFCITGNHEMNTTPVSDKRKSKQLSLF